jgi:Arc/MetJ-type ribon-helix-helix transcriptional regulator
MAPKSVRFEMRLELGLVEQIDAWRRGQDDLPSRAEAIRQLVERALGSADTRPTTARAQEKAAELASKEIDKLKTQDADGEKRHQRKRRLIKGPREFRDIRRTRSGK